MGIAIVPAMTTPRLMLRPLELADAPAIQESFACWEVVEFLSASVPWPYPDDGALVFVRDIALSAMRAGRAWHWSIRPRDEPDRLIGAIGLMDNDDDNRGFWLHPAWRGQGLMTEACIAANDYWFGTLGKKVLRAPKAAANTASRRISARSGMRLLRVEERDYVSGRLPGEVWEITDEEWRRMRSRHPLAPVAALR